MWDVGLSIVKRTQNTEHRTQNTYSTALQQKREASKKLDTMLMKMYTSLAPFMLFATATAAVAVDPASLTFAAFSGSSPFFEPVYHGWNDTCAKLGVNCIYRTENKNYRATDAVKDFVAMGVDGIALKASGDRDLLREMMANATNLHGIPIATFDEDVENSTRSVYVGTDNEFMGSTMARMLKQLRPEGGTFVIIGNKDDRDPGFIEEITNNNDRDDRPHWYQIDDHENIPYEGGGAPGFAAQIHGYVGKHSPTAFVIMRQTPMRFENWTGLVEQYRDRNITYIGTDGSDYQLDYLSRRYVDGLIGQLPYEFGAFSVQALYDLAVKKAQAQEQGEDFPKQEEVSTANVKKIPTNLVSYNLIPLELPQLQVDQNLLGGLRAVGFTCFAFAALVTLLCVAWTCYYINGVVVKASQPFFLLMMAAGVLIMSSTLIPLSFDDKGAEIPYSKRVGICMSIPWLAFTGFTLTFSALFAKTKRINSLFEKSSELTRIKISPKDVMAPCFMLMTCNWIVLVCWTIVDPLTYEREFILGTDFWNREFASHGQCQSEHAAAYLVSLGVGKFVLSICKRLQIHFSQITYLFRINSSSFPSKFGCPCNCLLASYQSTTYHYRICGSELYWTFRLQHVSSIFDRHSHRGCCERHPRGLLFGLNVLDLFALHGPFGLGICPKNVLATQICWNERKRSTKTHGPSSSKKCSIL